MTWVLTDNAWICAGVFAGASLILTFRQIFLHLYYYTKPQYQRWICRILYMAPIYAIASWLSLHFYDYSIYFDTVRNCYEAFVIYSFLSLCFAYLGGESAILQGLHGKYSKPSWFLLTCCVKPFPYDVHFLLVCKRCCLQFCILKPLLSALTLILEPLGYYIDGDFSPTQSYLYILIVYNLSILFALMALLWFYVAAKDLLAPYKPVLKFLIVKSVIFLAFWQGVVIAGAEYAGYIKGDDKESDPGKMGAAYQNFIICIEMFFVSVAHIYGFPVAPYITSDPEAIENADKSRLKLASIQRVSNNLRKTLNPQDIMQDTVRNFSKKYTTYHQQAEEDPETNGFHDGTGLHDSDRPDGNTENGAAAAATNGLNGSGVGVANGAAPINLSEISTMLTDDDDEDGMDTEALQRKPMLQRKSSKSSLSGGSFGDGETDFEPPRGDSFA